MTRFQKRIIAGCFIVYFCAYIGRLNLSAALGKIIEDTGITAAQGGLFQTLFALLYAAGQLVFGTLSDKFRPRRMLLVGLAGSALANALFASSSSMLALCAMWMANGIFQSMLWTPIVRLMQQHFDPQKRKTASLIISGTLAAGHFFAWLLADIMAQNFSWRMSFVAPAVVLVAAGVSALVLLPGGKAEAGTKTISSGSVPFGALLKTGLVFVLLGCITNGFVRDSIITWGPTILMGENSDSMMFSLIIPVINLFGIAAGAYMVRHIKTSIRALVGGMMGAVALCTLGAFAAQNAGVVALAALLGVTSAILYGSNPLLTTLIPLEYDWSGRVGFVAGLVDCFIYIGSALSGTFVGMLHDKTGTWSSLYLVWAAVAVIGALLLLKKSKKTA